MLFNTVKKISGLVLAILFFITTGWLFCRHVSQNHWSSLRGWFRPMTVSRRQRNSLPSGPGTGSLFTQRGDGKRFRLVSAQFAALSDEAMTDPLTGLYNRRGFYEQLTYIKNLKNQCAIAVDIDHFKAINDRFGHSTGDDVLVHTADLLRLTCRKEDVISRFGGEEFVIL